jgi:hypothetical protein
MRRKISVSKLLKSNKLIKVWLQMALNKIGINILIRIKFIKFIRIFNFLYKRKIRPANIIIKSASKKKYREMSMTSFYEFLPTLTTFLPIIVLIILARCFLEPLNESTSQGQL